MALSPKARPDLTSGFCVDAQAIAAAWPEGIGDLRLASPRRRMSSPKALLAVLVVAATGVGGCSAAASVDEQAANAAALERAFPVVKELQVLNAWHRDGCWYIEYRRGTYGRSGDTDNCYADSASPSPFDAKAKADLDKLAKAAGDDTFRSVTQVAYTPDGTLSGVVFDAYGDTYVYTLDGSAPDLLVNEPDSRRITFRWYFIHPDWN